MIRTGREAHIRRNAPEERARDDGRGQRKLSIWRIRGFLYESDGRGPSRRSDHMRPDHAVGTVRAELAQKKRRSCGSEQTDTSASSAALRTPQSSPWARSECSPSQAGLAWPSAVRKRRKGARRFATGSHASASFELDLRARRACTGGSPPEFQHAGVVTVQSAGLWGAPSEIAGCCQLLRCRGRLDARGMTVRIGCTRGSSLMMMSNQKDGKGCEDDISDDQHLIQPGETNVG